MHANSDSPPTLIALTSVAATQHRIMCAIDLRGVLPRDVIAQLWEGFDVLGVRIKSA